MLQCRLADGCASLSERILNGEREPMLSLYAAAVTDDVKEQLELVRLCRLLVVYEPKNKVLSLQLKRERALA